MMKNDYKLVNGEPFNKDLKSINVKTYEEQKQVVKNYIKERYFNDKRDGYRMVLLTIVLTVFLVITLDVPIHWIAVKTHLPIILLTVLNAVISFMVAIRVVATVEAFSKGIWQDSYPKTPAQKELFQYPQTTKKLFLKNYSNIMLLG